MTERRERYRPVGSQHALEYRRDARGRLRGLRGGRREYLRHEPDGTRVLGDDLLRLRERAHPPTRTPAGEETPAEFVRELRAGERSWTERYRFDARGRPCEVDGVEVRRDAQGRVVACLDGEAGWTYAYDARGVCAVEGPEGVRHITRDDAGRPLRVREGGGPARRLEHDATGRRRGLPRRPPGWQVDGLGRLWSVSDARGRVRHTFLWDGPACIGRIDGQVGDPLAAAFSLDATLTPVRVITREGMTRLPRDAFGEGLLAPGAGGPVPGLFGGAVHAGFVELPGRSLDPRLGCFAAPDPWHGRADDPRRARGYGGPLWAEQAGGPYAVCQHDPLARSDPSGCSSMWWIIPADIFWAGSNSLLGILGWDGTLNFWSSMFASLFSDSDAAEDFFDSDPMVALRAGTQGARRGGLLTTRFMLHHEFFLPKEEWQDEARVRCFLPEQVAGGVRSPAAFRPELYGSLLLAEPSGADAFVLDGSVARGGVNAREPGALAWSRHGGDAEPALPGLREPWFPEGGLHFTPPGRQLLGEQTGGLTEVIPTHPFYEGTTTRFETLDVPGHGLRNGDLVLVEDAFSILEVAVRDVRGDELELELPDDYNPAGTIRLRGADAHVPGLAMVAPAFPAPITQLQAPPGMTPAQTAFVHALALGDVLELAQGGAALGQDIVEGLEGRVLLDAPLPAAMAGPIRVSAMQTLVPPGAPRPAANLGVTGANVNVLRFPAGQVPDAGELLRVQDPGGANHVAVRVEAAAVAAEPGDNPGDVRRRVDRSMGALGADGDPVEWQRIRGPLPLGERNGGPEGPAQLTFTPTTLAEVPDSGYLRAEDSAGLVCVREVTGHAYLAIDLRRARPGAGNLDVARIPTRDPDEDGLELTTRLRYTQAAAQPLPANTKLLVLWELNAANFANAFTPTRHVGDVPAPPDANRLVFTLPAARAPAQDWPVVGQLVGVHDPGGAGADHLRLVERLELKLRLDRPLPAGHDGDLRIARLQEVGPRWLGEPMGGRHVLLRPRALDGAGPGPGPSVRVEFPRLLAGELVQVTWSDAPRVYRVQAVEGCLLELAGDVFPAGPTVLNVQRLGLEDANGSRSILGTHGRRAGGNDLIFRVWRPDGLAGGDLVGIAVGDKTWPARLDNGVDREFRAHFTPAFGGAILGAELVRLSIPSVNAYPRFDQVGARIELGEIDDAAIVPDSAHSVIAVPYLAAPPGVQAGTFSQGRVRIPEAPDGEWELLRLDALSEHELVHTEQQTMWGPLFFGWWPHRAFYSIFEAAGVPLNMDVTTFVPVEFSRDGGQLVITVSDADADAIQLGDEEDVEAAWQGELMRGRLLDRRTLQLDSPLEPHLAGAGHLRRFTWSETDELGEEIGVGIARFLSTWLPQFLTVGGLLRTVLGLTWVGLIDGLVHLVYGLINLTREFSGRAATVEDDGSTLLLSEADAGALAGVDYLLIVSGERSYVRRQLHTRASGDPIPPGTLLLAQPVELRGAVEVDCFEDTNPRNTWDWKDYFPAHVPDPALPWRIQVEHGLDALDPFNPVRHHNRLTVLFDDQSEAERVVRRVHEDGTAELDQPIPREHRARAFAVAIHSPADPEGSGGEALLEATTHQLTNRIVRWLTDPWGEAWDLLPQDEGGQIARHVLRSVMSSTSFSLLFPGWLLWDRTFRDGGGSLARMEQEASRRSGHLYTHLGRLRGQVEPTDDGRTRPTRFRQRVGDLGWYWVWPDDYTGTSLEVGPTGRYDRAGVHVERPEYHLVLPHVTAPGPIPPPGPFGPVPGHDINGTRQAGLPATLPGLAVADALTRKNATNPHHASVVNFSDGGAPRRGFAAAPRGYLPTSPGLQRTTGIYMAFARPGLHRVTVRDGIGWRDDDAAAAITEEVAELWFEVDAQDVRVTVGGVEVREDIGDLGATVPLSPLELVITQRADFLVDVDGVDREFRVNLTRPRTGPLLRAHRGVFGLFLAEPRALIVQSPPQGTEAHADGHWHRWFHGNPETGPREGAAGAAHTHTVAAGAAVTGPGPDGHTHPLLRHEEEVELSRVYRYNTATRSFADPLLNTHGMHLPADLHVPVRRFRVRVIDTIPLRRVQSTAAGDKVPGRKVNEEGFLLVPSAVRGPLAFSFRYDPPLLLAQRDPVIDAAEVPVPEPDVLPFIHDGEVWRLKCRDDTPPEAELQVHVRLPVRRGALQGELQVRYLLQPLLHLVEPDGTVDYSVPATTMLELELQEFGTNAPRPPRTVRLDPLDGTINPNVNGNRVELHTTAASAGKTYTVTVERDGPGPTGEWARRSFQVT